MTTSPPAPAHTNPIATLGIVGLCTLIVLTIVTVIGGIVVIVHPATLDFSAYVRDLSIAWGLLGIGHGLDPASKP